MNITHRCLRSFKTIALISTLLMLSLPSRADMICSAISYVCDIDKKELRLTTEQKSCGSGGSPFKLFDSKLSGLYDADFMRKPIIKECPLGTVPLTVVISSDCAVGNGETVPAVRIFRDKWLNLEKVKTRIKTKSEPFVRAAGFGSMCGAGDDKYEMFFDQITVRLLKTTPTESFSVEMR